MNRPHAKQTSYQFVEGPVVNLQQLLALRYPAKALNLANTKKIHSSLSGGHRSTFRGRGMDFDEVRLYQAGDDVRNIDWRVTARTAKTHTKVFKEEKERPLILTIDQRSCMAFGSRVTYKSVQAAQIAALLGWAGLNNNDKVGGLVFNDELHNEIKPKRHHNALLSLLHYTAEFNQSLPEKLNNPALQQTLSLQNILEKTLYLAKPGSSVFIFSDFHDYDSSCEKILSKINKHTDPHIFVIADLMERSLPKNNKLSISDGNKRILINTFNKSLLEIYQNEFDSKLIFISKSLKKLGIRSDLIWTYQNPVHVLLNVFNLKSLPNNSLSISDVA